MKNLKATYKVAFLLAEMTRLSLAKLSINSLFSIISIVAVFSIILRYDLY